MISDTGPVATPFASSREAINSVSAANGRKVTIAPVAVVSFHADDGISIERGVELKGTTVKVSGSGGGTPPLKTTLKDPHCWTDENEMELNFETTVGGPKVKAATKASTMYDLDDGIVGTTLK